MTEAATRASLRVATMIEAEKGKKKQKYLEAQGRGRRRRDNLPGRVIILYLAAGALLPKTGATNWSSCILLKLDAEKNKGNMAPGELS